MVSMWSDQSIVDLIHTAYDNVKTRNAYLARLTKLKEYCNEKEGDLNYIIILSDPDKYYPVIRKHYENASSRKNVLTVILAIFKQSPALAQLLSEQRSQWKNFHDNMNSYEGAKYAKNMPDMKQLSKYTSFQEMETKYLELKVGTPHDNKFMSQWFIFLSIVISTPPKRADYSSMKVYYDTDPHVTGENYVVMLSGKPSYMVFTTYKTEKKVTHKDGTDATSRIEETMSMDTYRDIMASLRRWPRDYLFVNKTKKPFASNNAFTKWVIYMFEELFGKSTGLSMLRHVYITEKIDMNNTSTEERNDIARQMMHSTGLQDKYRWNRDKVCQTMKAMCKGP